jgi:hypothetical protein
MNRQRDGLTICFLALVAAAGSWLTSSMAVSAGAFPGRADSGYNDVWFDSDTRDALLRLTVTGEEITAERHPMEGLMMRAPVRVLMRLAPGLGGVSILRLLLAAAALLWIASIYSCLRLSGCRWIDATLFSLLALSSATFMFWFAVPDYFVFSAVSAMPAMLLAAWAGRGPSRESPALLAGVLSASVTVTNAMFGVASIVVAHRRSRALQIIVNGFCVLVLLWHAQRAIYPDVESPLADTGYQEFFWLPDGHHPWGPLSAFVFHSVVMPQVQVAPTRTVLDAYADDYRVYPQLTVQPAWPGSTGLVGMLAVTAWLGILMLGAIGLWRGAVPPAWRNFLLLVTAGQLSLHLLFTAETFLYAPHYLPLLIMIGAAGTVTVYQRQVRALVVILLISVTINNAGELVRSFTLVPPITALHVLEGDQ